MMGVFYLTFGDIRDTICRQMRHFERPCGLGMGNALHHKVRFKLRKNHCSQLGVQQSIPFWPALHASYLSISQGIDNIVVVV